MRLKYTYLNKKFYLFSGSAPETHRLEVTLFGTEEELKELLNMVYIKCMKEVKIEAKE